MDAPHALRTHEVANQPPPLADLNLFESDAALREGLVRGGGGFALEALRRYGALAGSADFQALGEQANAHPPTLRSHDRFGHRIDEVEFHPAWHAVMRAAMARRSISCQAGWNSTSSMRWPKRSWLRSSGG